MLLTSIFLSALFAGIVATLVTIAIEKFGGRTGGVLATIPTTIVPAALGMYSISGEAEFAQSMSIVPLGMMVNAIFCWYGFMHLIGLVCPLLERRFSL